MDTVKIRELSEKAGVALEDLLIVEDNDGTKVMQVKQFQSLLQQSMYYNTLDDMQNASLSEGDVVKTLGYRNINDGGGALYKIVYAPTDVQDRALIQYLHTSDTLRAHLIHDQTLNVLQCGAVGDGMQDDYDELTKLLSYDYPLYFPQKFYRVSGSLEIPSNTTIDFNNSTIYCATSSCITLGLNKAVKNVTIKNAIFAGRYGIDIYPGAENITIENCKFVATNTVVMSKAIQICGAQNVTVSGCTIGDKDFEVQYGIILSSAKFNNTNYGNANIRIVDNDITASTYGIQCISTIKDRAVSFVGNRIRGFKTSTANTAVGVMISCLSEYVALTNTLITNVNKGVVISGAYDPTVAITDIVVDAAIIMYNFASGSAKIYLNGIQKFSAGREDANRGTVAAGNCYIFETMVSTLYLNTSIDANSLNGSDKIIQAMTSLNGTLIDSVPTGIKPVIQITNTSQLNTNLDNPIPGYMNTAIYIGMTGNINDIPHPALAGQIISVFGNGGILKHNVNMDLGGDITLNKYTPVVLKNNHGTWDRVQ